MDTGALSIPSSLKELGHNDVSSHQVATNMDIWFPISILSPRIGSTSTEVAALDEINTLVRKVMLAFEW